VARGPRGERALAEHAASGPPDDEQQGEQRLNPTGPISAIPVPAAPPRGVLVHLAESGTSLVVEPGTKVGSVMPAEVAGTRVVAARLDRRLVSLQTPLLAEAQLAPLAMNHWEGERIYRRSLGLLLLEAAAMCTPPLRLSLGPSLGFGQPLRIEGTTNLTAAVDQLRAAAARLVSEGRPFLEATRTTEEARVQLTAQGDEEAVRLLRYERHGLVRLVSCGVIQAMSYGPCVPFTSWLDHLSIGVRGSEVFVIYREQRHPRWSTMQLVANAPPKRASDMSDQHERWLAKLAVHGVGSLNDLCVHGSVGEMVAVAEGFHEKRVADIAGEITARAPAVSVISIAGPSSSGKTTFIRRLSTQLRVLGITPRTLSLDDYYRERSAMQPDADGQLDFEAFEALDVGLLHEHLAGLLAGRAVRTASFDFPHGLSLPAGGPEIQLARGEVLLVEGLHGLNPRLFAGQLDEHQVFRVFVNPSTSLAFDRLSRVNTSDLRLLRRIVRDRGTAPGDNIRRWPAVRHGERTHIFPHLAQADAVFDSSLVYEPGVIKVFAERYLLEVEPSDPAYFTAQRLRLLLDAFVAIDPEHVPRASLLREFIGGSPQK
jgi:uridine kinase